MEEDACASLSVIEIDDCGGSWREGMRPILDAAPVADHQHLAMRSGLDHYLIQVLASATSQDDFHGAGIPATGGDICIVDLTQLVEHPLAAKPTASVLVSRPLLEKALGPRSLHGLILEAHWPMTPLVASYVRSLCSLASPLPDLQASAAQEALATLLAAALKGNMPDDGHAVLPQGALLHQTIVDFIARNLYLQELSPDFLCQRFNVSRAHLYRAFAADGGVAKVLRDMRLDAAYGELTDAGRAQHSITEIAYNLGFSSAGQLLRSFRTRFDLTPREARAHACVLG